LAALIWLLRGTVKISQYSEIYSCSYLETESVAVFDVFTVFLQKESMLQDIAFGS
jgi:hypothetical protein